MSHGRLVDMGDCRLAEAVVVTDLMEDLCIRGEGSGLLDKSGSVVRGGLYEGFGYGTVGFVGEEAVADSEEPRDSEENEQETDEGDGLGVDGDADASSGDDAGEDSLFDLGEFDEVDGTNEEDEGREAEDDGDYGVFSRDTGLNGGVPTPSPPTSGELKFWRRTGYIEFGVGPGGFGGRTRGFPCNVCGSI